MARTAQKHAAGDDDDDDDSWSEQIQLLLHKAEQRLSSSATSSKRTAELKPPQKVPKLDLRSVKHPYISTINGVARGNPRQMLSDEGRRKSKLVRKVRDPVLVKEKAEMKQHANAGFDFHYMPATRLSPELQADLRVLKVRGVLDPQRHYKKDFSKALAPNFSEVGRVIEGPTEYFSARLSRRERKRTFVETALANEISTGRYRTNYDKIQVSKCGGKKAYRNKLTSKRSRDF